MNGLNYRGYPGMSPEQIKDNVDQPWVIDMPNYRNPIYTKPLPRSIPEIDVDTLLKVSEIEPDRKLAILGIGIVLLWILS